MIFVARPCLARVRVVDVGAMTCSTLPLRAFAFYLIVPVGTTISVTSTAIVSASNDKIGHLTRRTLRFARTVRAALGMALWVSPCRERTGEVVALEATA